MESLAAAYWGGFFTVAVLMLAAATGAAVKGFRRVAVAGFTYALVPALFVSAYVGLLPFADQAVQARFITHLNVLGAMGLTSQLVHVLRGYRQPILGQRVQLTLLLAGAAVLVLSWFVAVQQGLWLSMAYTFTLGLWVLALALRKALRGNAVAWISVAGVALALLNLSALVWIHARAGAVPLVAHAVAAWSSVAYVAIMGWAMWTRYAYALELKQVMSQGPSFDPVTRLPSHAHAGKLVGSFLRSGSALPLGVIAVSLANLASLESLHGRAAYNHALYVAAGRLRRGAPMGAQLGRLGEDGFLILMRTDDAALLKHVAAKLRRILGRPIHVGLDLDPGDTHAVPSAWVAEVGIGITLRQEPDAAGSAVVTARAMSRAALAAPGRIVYSEGRDGPCVEVAAELEPAA